MLDASLSAPRLAKTRLIVFWTGQDSQTGNNRGCVKRSSMYHQSKQTAQKRQNPNDQAPNLPSLMELGRNGQSCVQQDPNFHAGMRQDPNFICHMEGPNHHNHLEQNQNFMQQGPSWQIPNWQHTNWQSPNWHSPNWHGPNRHGPMQPRLNSEGPLQQVPDRFEYHGSHRGNTSRPNFFQYKPRNFH